MSVEHPLREGRESRYGEPPTMPDIDPRVPGAPQERPDWWPDWWQLGHDDEDSER
jgi:hypothetical protein